MTENDIRNDTIDECIKAIANVMRIDPDSAGGPIFDALRDLKKTSSDHHDDTE